MKNLLKVVRNRACSYMNSGTYLQNLQILDNSHRTETQEIPTLLMHEHDAQLVPSFKSGFYLWVTQLLHTYIFVKIV